ncbi:leucine-rich repeat domain-containing protein [Malacoplasma iowae]|uniref:leucine-rich repeat domain-containing protein n=1 Tax=Malacoplasma iowae TaxID=2116 RepID=UPI002A18D780|nr:leucine-rich repeat domain-containing protein [Malacoplasma iowae]WPL40280.1 leucine-rich repeat domain-containing protein [Malacoplasma iowae]
MGKRKFLKPLFITLGCVLVVGVAGSLIYLDRIQSNTQNKNQSIIDNISFNEASTIFGKENIRINGDGKVSISKFIPQKNASTDVFDTLVLPSKIDGKDVVYSEGYYTELNSYFKKNGTGYDSEKIKSIKKLLIADNKAFTMLRLKNDINNAPSFLTSLEYVEIGSGVEIVPDGFFKGLKSIKTVDISTSVKTIGAQAFYACSSLTEINFKGTDEKIWIDSSAFAGCKNLKTINFANIKKLNYEIAKLPSDKKSLLFWKIWWLFNGSGSSENKITITTTPEFKSELESVQKYLENNKQDVNFDNINFDVRK